MLIQEYYFEYFAQIDKMRDVSKKFIQKEAYKWAPEGVGSICPANK